MGGLPSPVVLDPVADPWVTLRVTVPAGEADLVAGHLWSAGVSGIEERTLPVPCPDEGGTCVELLAGITACGADGALEVLGGRWMAEVVPVEGDAWLDTWREYARAWRAGGRLVVAPTWQDLPEWAGPQDVVVRLDPGRAFGSGAHPTTRLCLTVLEDQVASGSRVLDAGCGSGVLAVAAALLGASAVEAVDIDPEALRATAANAGVNGVAGTVRATNPTVDRVEGTFGVVVANIAAATLVALAPGLAVRAEPGGTVVLSGLLADQVDDVVEAFAAEGLARCTTAADGEWRALVLRRDDDART